ncbi:MAG: DUF3467 domain-containing protein [Bacteroidaceae bacterium]|nr:DUF3467 domain-containing protein [Bacteroidaceae bacterium]MBR1787598.1 DUF3467 domain-containing protein [Bacteroidaceae bacterium]
MDKQQPQIQFELRPEVAQGVYANLAIITHSSSEFVIDMAAVLPGLQKADVRSRIVMAPEHAKRLMLALHDNLQKYEQQFGEIDLQPQRQGPRQGSTIMPFTIKPGEA